MRVPAHVVLAFALAGLPACVGTEIGNPASAQNSDVSVDFVAIDELATALTLDNGIEIDRAWLGIGDLRFRHQDRCGDEPSASTTGGFLVDLLADEAEVGVKLPEGTYCRLDVRPKRGGKEGFLADAPEMDGLTVLAEGSFEGTPLVIRYEGDDEISFFGDFAIEAGPQTLFVGFELQSWFIDVDLATAEVTNGTIELSDGENSSLLGQIGDNFEQSITIAVDKDGDGVLGVGELRREDP